MAEDSTSTPSNFETARERMERAVTRLETAVQASREGLGKRAEELEGELAAAREEVAQLKSTSRTVSDRLDATIDNIRAALNE